MANSGSAGRSRLVTLLLFLGLALAVFAPAAEAAEHELLASDAQSNDQFGSSVAIDGNVAVVGAPHDNLNHGAAYVFVRSGGVWAEAAKLAAGDGANGDQFGISVAIKGDVVAVGAYAKTVGQGAAYVFVKPAGGWSAPPATPMLHTAKLTASGAPSVRQLGRSIDVGGVDGDVVVVGAPLDDAARGAVYLFLRPGAAWAGTLNEDAKLTAAIADAAAGDQLGFSTAISGDGEVVGGGAPADDSGRGSVRVFLRPPGGWSGSVEHSAKLIAGDGTPGDQLGWSTDVGGDGVVSGARGDDSARGSAYVFVPPSGGWAGLVPNVAKLVASEGTPGDEFGYAVAINGTRAVVGAPFDDLGGDSLYVYDRPFTGWAGTVFESSKLVSTTGARGDALGYSTGISGDTTIAGAPFRDELRGAAVIFDLPPTRVEIRSVSAERSPRGVLVRWRMAAELDVLGFNVFREQAGKRVRLNRSLVSAHSPSDRGTYAFLDRSARQSVRSRYWIQSLHVDGTRAWHGPALARQPQ